MFFQPKKGYTNIAAKQGNAEERPDAGCEIIRLRAAAASAALKNTGYLPADKPQGVWGTESSSVRKPACLQRKSGTENKQVPILLQA